jgi:N,N'-diacetyllegionaminate synthase
MNEVNLRAMVTMKKKLGCLVGYSDHTLGLTVPIMAATLGAVIVEKHFTLDRNMAGPDHKASLEPNELKSMVQLLKKVRKILGNDEKKPSKSEKRIMPLVRKSIVAKKDLQAGTKLTSDLVTSKRPGDGLSPLNLNNILGKQLKKNVRKNGKILISELD